MARHFFAEAARGFAAAGDDMACLKAIAGVIDTCYAEWSDFSSLDPWIIQLIALLDRKIVFASAADELQSVSTALVALLYRQPAHPRLPELAARAHSVLSGEIGANELVGAGTYLLNCYNWMGETGLAREVIARVTPHLGIADVSPMRRAWWSARLAYHHYIAGEPQSTLAALQTATGIAHEHSQPIVENVVLLYAAFHHLSEGEPGEAKQALASFEQRLQPNRRLDCAIASYQRAWIALLENNLDAALEFGSKAVSLAEQAGVPNVQAYFLLLVAFAHAGKGDARLALSTWESAHAATDPLRFPLFEFTAQLVRADLAVQASNATDCRRALGVALAIGARHDYANNLFWLPASMARLCARALEWDIETDYVGRLIRRRLLPPDQQASRWPWPLRIFTLGAFRVERQGEAIRFSRKAQRRPLALLMALIALGGKNINANLLAEMLWPDADGDAARAALGTALYRLRHLLDTDEAVRLSDGKLSLDPQRVWVDCWAFERLAEQVAAGGAGDVTAAALFELYGNHFLNREEEQPWMLQPRDKLKGLMGRALETAGHRLEQTEKWAMAAEIYERGIALDMLAEPLYRRLMVCQAKQDRVAQAIETYRRCRQALSVVLGIPPSAETEALRRSLG
jgi:DNA-binding SARP family transcriptional activator